MPTPILIELRPESRPAFNIIFRGLGNAIYDKADNGVILPDSCDADGSLFLNGLPEDYVGDQITLDGSNEGTVTFVLLSEMIPVIRNAGSGSYGRVGTDGCGPGFVYDGTHFEHDEDLGVLETSSVCENGTIRSETRTLSNRPNDEYAWAYMDADPETANEKAEIQCDVMQANGEMMEVDGGIAPKAEQAIRTNPGLGDEMSDVTEQVQRKMKKLHIIEAS